ncbi:MAG TPA: hypothetical protein VFC05_05070 [Nitrososphaeraceae archaeon]|nr:hypothetical protein [Nitrososphaeraceae archaeon]
MSLFNSLTLIPSSHPFILFIIKSVISKEYLPGFPFILSRANIGSVKADTL